MYAAAYASVVHIFIKINFIFLSFFFICLQDKSFFGLKKFNMIVFRNLAYQGNYNFISNRR